MCWCTLTCLSRIFSNSFAKVENYGKLLEKLVSSMSCECVLWTSIMWKLSCLCKDQFRRPPSCRRLYRKPLRKACQVRRWLLNNAENGWRTPKRMQTWKCHSPWDRIYILTFKTYARKLGNIFFEKYLIILLLSIRHPIKENMEEPMRRLTNVTGSIEGRAQKNGETLGKKRPEMPRPVSPTGIKWAQHSPAWSTLQAWLCWVFAGGHIKLDYQDLFSSDSLPTYISVTSGWKETERKQTMKPWNMG